MEHLLELARLLDRYGHLLTKRQQSIVSDYANENYTLAEIAENAGISRQGVRDTLVRAEQTLRLYEDRLGLVRRLDAQQELLRSIERSAARLPDGAEKAALLDGVLRIGGLWEDE